MRKVAPFVGRSRTRTPSAPTPRCRSQIFEICSDANCKSPARLSIMTKSFPAPFIFVKRSMGSLYHILPSKPNERSDAPGCQTGVAAQEFKFYLFRVVLKNYLARIILSLAPFFGARELGQAPLAPGRFNDLILQQVQQMPSGGRYSASRVATIPLQSAAHFESGKFFVLPDAASPSYCSGATYLVFMKTIEALRAKGALQLDYATLESL